MAETSNQGKTEYQRTTAVEGNTQSVLRREHADAARAGLSKNSDIENRKATTDWAKSQSVVCLTLLIFQQTVRNCPHAGRAVPSGTPNKGILSLSSVCPYQSLRQSNTHYRKNQPRITHCPKQPPSRARERPCNGSIATAPSDDPKHTNNRPRRR